MKKLAAVVLVFLLVFGAIAGPTLADQESGLNAAKKVEFDGGKLEIPDKDGVAPNPISIGGSGSR